MDNMRYMCFCRSFFSNVDTFISHVTCCPQIKNSNALNAQSEKMIIDKLSEYSKINEDLKSDFKLKLMKSWAIVVDEDQSSIKSDKTTAKLWGRRLPKRTKVPYLSRAVPLSTDHSYERCQCGAVFVTRMGKRQHQARFCEFVKNKTKKLPSNTDTVENVTQNNFIEQITALNENHVITNDENNVITIMERNITMQIPDLL